jgi:UDP-N-acetylmuramate dehydrogenase
MNATMISCAEKISSIQDCIFYEDIDLTSYTTMRLSSRGDLVEVKSVEALQKLLPLLTSLRKKYLVIGWGANQILPPECEEIIIHLDFAFDLTYFDETRDEYELPASMGLNYLTSHAVKFGLSGWEVFTGIPASLGGAIFMNAGTALGEIGAVIKRVRIVDRQGLLREEVMGPRSFSYRHNHFIQEGDVIVSATLFHKGLKPEISQKIREYLDYRKKTQPLATKNCGCVFKNPAKELQAGRIIDQLGLKGLSVGGLRVSPKHANFIENTGASTWDHFHELVSIIKFNTDHFYGLEFDLEVKTPLTATDN